MEMVMWLWYRKRLQNNLKDRIDACWISKQELQAMGIKPEAIKKTINQFSGDNTLI